MGLYVAWLCLLLSLDLAVPAALGLIYMRTAFAKPLSF